MSSFLSLPFGYEIGRQVVGQQRSVGRCEIAAHDIVIVDVDVCEDRLVQLSASRTGRRRVQLLGSHEQRQHRLKVANDDVGVHLVSLDFGSGGGSLSGQTDLFSLEVIDGDGVVEVSTDELVALLLKADQVSAGLIGLRKHLRKNLVDVQPDIGPDLLGTVDGCGDRSPMPFDKVLDNVSLNCLETAAVLVVLSSEAIEI